MILLLAVGAAATAAWKGWIYNPFSHGPTGPEIFTAFSQITSAHTITTINAGLEPRDANVEPIDFTVATTVKAPAPSANSSVTINGTHRNAETILDTNFGDTTDLGQPAPTSPAPSVPTFLKLIPGDLSFNLKVTSDWQKAEMLADTQTRIEGTYNANNIQATLDLEIRHIGDKTYIHPTKIPLPIPVIDLTALSDKWIDTDTKLGTDDILDYGFKIDPSVTPKPNPANITAEAQAWMEEAYKNSGITIGDAKRETLNGVGVWTYAIAIDGEKVRTAFLTVAENRSSLISDENYQIFSDKAIENMKDDAQSAVAVAILNQFTGSASVRQDNNLPAAFLFSVKIAPKTDNEKFSNKQISVSVATTFSNINEAVAITVPENTINFMQAMGFVSGDTQEKMDFDRQTTNITSIRRALKAYFDDKKNISSNVKRP